ncbi:ornithine carbamoyltransferase [Bradyrhizobium valentinum]|uniref:Ornithine carbamoyltransferase n=1 Tax=Bradyrhizobium valentinum TaxID=1518501 RepID=A0A0R3KFY2_9BRAD|nr:ornithine carbamoyltransferase [Bradyrhizobium valentinum]KRQ94616.1 ornithine carbamoyltransferase [Bradyrhizobium valentinum]KRR08567.1 ornithine carbamoyltransferase [Bradyrhizobium valentinum]
MRMEPNKDFLEFHGLPKEIIFSLIDRAQSLATAWDDRTMPQSLSGKRVALIADDSGWRNTSAFDLGVQAMGGICVQSPIKFNVHEATADLARYLDNWFDILVIRTKELSALKELASIAKAPVVNARTRSNHPCEILGDLAYVQSKKGTLEGMKVVGVAPDANIIRSWVEASLSMPIQVRQVYPENWHVKDVSLLGPNFAASTDLAELWDADVIVTDSWPSDANEEQMREYRISMPILDKCRPDAIFLPCPPVSREKEVTANAMRHPACQSAAAKAYLLHAQNALLEWIAT